MKDTELLLDLRKIEDINWAKINDLPGMLHKADRSFKDIFYVYVCTARWMVVAFTGSVPDLGERL